MLIPRSEYPRPQFVRTEWLCLNGPWQFEVDAGDSGLDRGMRDRDLEETITVPFCPESELSGIGRTDFIRAVWYRRVVTIPESWAGMDTLLHFQAVDYDATVWVNGREAGRHRGGFSPFTCDLTGLVRPGEEAVIVVRARDETRDFKAVGKQSQLYGNHGCVYTRTTGIWQTVWMEPVPRTSLQRTRITPDVANGRFLIEQPLRNPRKGLRVRAVLSDRSGACARAEAPTGLDFAPRLTLEVPEDRLRTWAVGDPHLYDLRVELLDGDTVTDAFESYCGLRSVAIDGMAVLLNGEPVFQRLVLDQGYYPDGIMTAPSDGALEEDIRLSMEAGFNGARLHQKVFEERFLWHADRMGYLVWGEFGDWGCRDGARTLECQRMDASYITQWAEVILRDYAHPCIIGWCPLNETVQPITDTITGLDDVTRGMFLATKALDTTRPVLDASGYSHRVQETDIYDSHNYEQDPAAFAEQVGGLRDGKPYVNGDANHPISIAHAGQPYFVSEFGGIWWNPEAREGEDSWGYGERVTSLGAFYERFEGLCDALLDDPLMFGYCYTQLTDVYQEQNGIYTFDRRVKFDMERIRKAQQRRAAIESGENS
jgi:beta-galactosidase/beta-glucuronidase